METTKKILIVMLAITLVFLVMNTCTDVDQKNPDYSGEPKQIVTYQQAKVLYDTYSNRRVPIIKAYEDRYTKKEYDPKMQQQLKEGTIDSMSLEKTSKDAFNPTRYGYYDYKTIKKYIAYIEHEAALADVEISTLRFYFANYPEKGTLPGDREIKYPKKNTFLIVPTLRETDGEDYGFLTIEQKDGKRKAVLLKDQDSLIPGKSTQLLTTKNKSYAGFNLNGLLSNSSPFMPVLPPGDVHSLILNEGGLVPPPHNFQSDFN